MHAHYVNQCMMFIFFISTLPMHAISIQSGNTCVQPTIITSNFNNSSNAKQNTPRFFMSTSGSNRTDNALLNSTYISPETIVIQAIAYVYYNAYCKQYFHMSAQQKHALLSAWRYKTFTKNLLKLKHLEDDRVWELWHEFLKSKTLHGNDKQECEKIITTELEKRSIEKQRKQNDHLQQETTKKAKIIRCNSQKDILCNRMNLLSLDQKQCMYLPSDFAMIEQEYAHCSDICDQMIAIDDNNIWHLRKNALEKTLDQNFAQSWQEIPLSHQAQGYLISKNLKPDLYTTYYGTALQQEINRQNCATFELIAQQQRNFSTKTIFLDHATECIDASFWANEFEVMPLAMSLQDLGTKCYKVAQWIADNSILYAQAVVDGAVASASDFWHTINRPIDTITGLAQTLWFVCDSMALADEESIGFQLQTAQHIRNDRKELIASMINSGIDHFEKSDGPERVKMLTKFTSDCYFQHKAIQAIGSVAGVIRSQSGTLRTMEFVQDVIGHEPAFAGAADTISKATEELESLVQETVAHEIAIQKHTSPLPKRSKIFTMTESIGKVKKYGGKIPARDIELLHNTKYWIEYINARVKKPIETTLIKKYETMTPILENTKISICMDLDHITNPKYQIIKDASGSFYTIKLKGGHLAGTMRKLEQEGVVAIKSFKEFGSGCIEYQVEDLFSGQIFPHTEFPPHWNIEKIAEETKQLCEQFINKKQTTKIAKMPTNEDFKLKIIMDQEPLKHNCSVIEGTHNMHIVTSYPFFEELL